MDFWISDWISGFQIGFLDFRMDSWISGCISGFHSGFLDFRLDFCRRCMRFLASAATVVHKVVLTIHAVQVRLSCNIVLYLTSHEQQVNFIPQ